jgi:hypothetical protein
VPEFPVRELEQEAIAIGDAILGDNQDVSRVLNMHLVLLEEESFKERFTRVVHHLTGSVISLGHAADGDRDLGSVDD